MEKKAVRCDVLLSQGALLAAPPALRTPQGPRPSWPIKHARRLGYKAKQGYITYRIHVCSGGHKRLVPKGVTYRKTVHHGINRLKFVQSLQPVAKERAGCHCGATVVKIPRTNSLRLSSLIHSIMPSEGILTPNESPSQSTSTGRCKGWHLQGARAVALQRVRVPPHYWWLSPHSLEKAQCSPAPLSPLI